MKSVSRINLILYNEMGNKIQETRKFCSAQIFFCDHYNEIFTEDLFPHFRMGCGTIKI